MQRRPISNTRPPSGNTKAAIRDQHLAWFHKICEATPEQLRSMALARGISVDGKTAEELGSLLLAVGVKARG